MLKHKSKLKWPKLKGDETIFEYFVDGQGQWCHWRERVEGYSDPPER